MVGFIENHREVIVAFDFFTVRTLTSKLLYCFFVIAPGRCKTPHFNVTRHPTAEWVIQQLRETFPEAAPYRYAILDRDSSFDDEVISFLKVTDKTTLEKLDLAWVNFQVLRRSCSSLPDDPGIDGKIVADQLGNTLDVSQNGYTTVGILRPREAVTTPNQPITGLPPQPSHRQL